MTRNSDIKPEMKPVIQPGILEIAPYEGGLAKLPGRTNLRKLSSNENPLGPSPKALAAAQEALTNMAVYPSADHAELRLAIGEQHGVDPAQIICGNGSDELLTLIGQAYAGPGNNVLYCEHGFSMYPIIAHSVGARPVKVRETDRRADIDALLEAVTPDTAMIYLANPNNPTGTMLNGGEITRLADALPPHVMLVLDGAYAEYVADPAFDGGLGLAQARDNVMVTRTFSKIYGLGGMRVGWAVGSAHNINVLNRIRGPFNVAAPSLAAAKAAMQDQAYIKECRDENNRLRDALQARLVGLGLAVDPSHANFLLVRFSDAAQAERAFDALADAGLIVRKVAGYGFPEALRITIGDAAACALIGDVLSGFMEQDA